MDRKREDSFLWGCIYVCCAIGAWIWIREFVL